MMMMMIAFITIKCSLVPLLEGLWSSNSWEFENTRQSIGHRCHDTAFLTPCYLLALLRELSQCPRVVLSDGINDHCLYSYLSLFYGAAATVFLSGGGWTPTRTPVGMGPKRFMLSVDDDTEFRSRCEFVFVYLGMISAKNRTSSNLIKSPKKNIVFAHHDRVL